MIFYVGAGNMHYVLCSWHIVGYTTTQFVADLDNLLIDARWLMWRTTYTQLKWFCLCTNNDTVYYTTACILYMYVLLVFI